MFGMGVMELVLILVIILLLFGGGKIASLGSGIGKGIRNFKSSVKGEDEIDVTPRELPRDGKDKK
jgi:sec-independent protein translocase protein TatA